ncbi:hypothetical protein AMTRI_Chr09g22920 [Amborella trichopoda]
MGSCSDEEEDHFFDTREEITSLSDSGSDYAEATENHSGFSELIYGNILYEVWLNKPGTIRERREKFLRMMGLARNGETLDSSSENGEIPGVERLKDNSGAVLMSSDFESNFSSSRSSLMSWSNGPVDSPDSRDLEEINSIDDDRENMVCRIRNLDNGTEFVIDNPSGDGVLSRLRRVGSDRLVTIDEFQRDIGLSPLVQHFMRRDLVESGISIEGLKRKKGWLRSLRAAASIVKRKKGGGSSSRSCNSENIVGSSNSVNPIHQIPQRVRVRHCKKRCKEFTAVYLGQEIQAHHGSIWTMKFSLDGRFLASGGEDGVVRIWEVMESAGTELGDTLEIDRSCRYFTVNESSELVPLYANKEQEGRFRGLRKSSGSACVVIPHKIFKLSEKPLHEFHGHTGDVLDLSWSQTKYLLSSSTDKTVRLWQVGKASCIKVFSHNNYVTSIQFNPVDDRYFISGSIDGKVRIWAIPGCQVVDWTDIREIVTAVCYRPDGQGGIVGSMAGNCRFYDASDNHLLLAAQVCLQGKKKSSCKRITGFQFAPSDPRKVMVTSADSQVRIFDGVDVICKYKGLRNTGSQISASFTSNGKHIVSASEDSHVYVWSYETPEGRTSKQAKSVWSCERFFSNNSSVAITWSGLKSEARPSSEVSLKTNSRTSDELTESSENGFHSSWDSCRETPSVSSSSPDRFSLGHGFFADSLARGSATWPEEKLPSTDALSSAQSTCKSQFKFLKTASEGMFASPHTWGLVIVTAGWDGRIRSFHNYGLPVRL